MEKSHFEQAKLWLQGAEYIANLPNEESHKYAVAVAMTIHAIIKANDALTYKYFSNVAKKHDDAPRLFDDVIKREPKLEPYANYKRYITEAITNKAKADYRASYFSKADYEGMKRNTEKFIKMVEGII